MSALLGLLYYLCIFLFMAAVVCALITIAIAWTICAAVRNHIRNQGEQT
jgi:hypothetical protein